MSPSILFTLTRHLAAFRGNAFENTALFVMAISRQRLYQKTLRAAGRCIRCGKEAAPSTRKGTGGKSMFCWDCMDKVRIARGIKTQKRTPVPSDDPLEGKP